MATNRIYCHLDSNNVFHDLSRGSLSARGSQPGLQDTNNRLVTIVDGRIFNCDELIAELRQDYGDGNRSCVADVIQGCYRHGNLQALDRLNGAFSFILWDEEKKLLVAGCDSIAANRIYYLHTREGFLCSSCLTTLTGTPGLDKEIETEALVQYLSLGYVNAPLTIYRNVHALSPGQYLIFQNNSVTIETFHDPIPNVWQFADVENMSEEELVDELDRRLIASVKRRLPADRKVAAYLSGGLDTSLICAILRKHTDAEISAFTVGSNDPRCDEAQYARETAAFLDINDHHVFYLKEDDFTDAVLALPAVYGQPFADISAIPSYFIARKVAESFDTVFTGEGPDGMYGGDVDFRLFYYYYKLMPYPLRIPFAAFAHFVARLRYGGPIAPSIHVSDLLRQPDFFWIFHKMFKGPELERILGRPVASETFWGHNFLKNRQDIPLHERLRLLFQTVFVTNCVLHKAWAAHRAASVDMICPYLDIDVVDFVQFLPSTYKRRNGKGKYLHRQLLRRYLPDRLINRPKRGFRINYNEFGVKTLRDLTDEYLTHKSLAETGLLNVGFALECVDGYYRGNSRMGPLLWNLLVFEIWRKKTSWSAPACRGESTPSVSKF